MREFLTLGVANAPLTNSTDRMEIFFTPVCHYHICSHPPPSASFIDSPANASLFCHHDPCVSKRSSTSNVLPENYL